MTENIFTFWEGPMPDYIKLCMETWPFPFIVLNYDNLKDYTDYNFKSAKKYSLPIQADAARVHVLRDNRGYWLDADTIMLSANLPDADILGDIWSGTNSIGYLHSSEPHLKFFEEWAKYQDEEMTKWPIHYHWAVLGNHFTDYYLRKNNDVKIGSIQPCWPEVYMIDGEAPRHAKYNEFYFSHKFQLSNIKKTNMLMLHNSWTPEWYKTFTRDQVLSYDCTLSNILREVLA